MGGQMWACPQRAGGRGVCKAAYQEEVGDKHHHLMREGTAYRRDPSPGAS